MYNRSRFLLVGLAASPMILVALGATGPGLALEPAGHAAAFLRDAGDILAGRSPGGRQGGTVQTKLARATTPTERVLSQVRERPGTAPAAIVPPPPLLSLADVPLAGPAIVLAPVGPGLSGLPIGGPGPIGGIGGATPVFVPVTGTGDSITPTTPTIPPVTPAVPEPVTWMTLLTGLGIVAWRLRHNRRATGAMGARGLPG